MEETATCPVCRNGRPEFICKAVLYSDQARDICGCGSCGAACFFPVPSFEEIGQCYPPAYFRGFFKRYWKDYYKGRASALQLARWRPKGRLLDVGCALGTMLAGTRDHSGWAVQGLEFSAEAAAMGQALNNLPIASAAVTGAPFAEGSFDYVNMNNVLEHEADPAAALKKVSKLLNAGGRLELTIPNGPVDLLPTAALYRRSGAPVKTNHAGHLFFFPRRALEALLKNSGFRILSFRNFHFKQGLKARGWLPNAYRSFLISGTTPPERKKEELSLEDYKRLIPPRPSWRAYYALFRLRRLFYASAIGFGGDFKIIAEKAPPSDATAAGFLL